MQRTKPDKMQQTLPKRDIMTRKDTSLRQRAKQYYIQFPFNQPIFSRARPCSPNVTYWELLEQDFYKLDNIPVTKHNSIKALKK